jgi:hypothetical protein
MYVADCCVGVDCVVEGRFGVRKVFEKVSK